MYNRGAEWGMVAFARGGCDFVKQMSWLEYFRDFHAQERFTTVVRRKVSQNPQHVDKATTATAKPHHVPLMSEVCNYS